MHTAKSERSSSPRHIFGLNAQYRKVSLSEAMASEGRTSPERTSSAGDALHSSLSVVPPPPPHERATSEPSVHKASDVSSDAAGRHGREKHVHAKSADFGSAKPGRGSSEEHGGGAVLPPRGVRQASGTFHYELCARATRVAIVGATPSRRHGPVLCPENGRARSSSHFGQGRRGRCRRLYGRRATGWPSGIRALPLAG